MYFWTEERSPLITNTAVTGTCRGIWREFVVVLDQAPYFYARDLWAFMSGDRSTKCLEDTSVECVCGSSLQAWYYPSHLPELNPLETCWNQFKDWFKYRLIEDLPTLKQTLATDVTTIYESDILGHICPEWVVKTSDRAYYFPTESPDLNPTEEYWRQLKLTPRKPLLRYF